MMAAGVILGWTNTMARRRISSKRSARKAPPRDRRPIGNLRVGVSEWNFRLTSENC